MKKNKSTDKQPNPYFIAFFTAILAGAFSVIGGYYTALFQSEKAISQMQIEYRVSTYNGFLEKIGRAKSPGISEILSMGSMINHLATDGEIQKFEDRIGELLKEQNTQDLYWQLNADLNVLRLHGSRRVTEIGDDILLSILLRGEEISWSKYPQEIVAVNDHWKTNQDQSVAYGWEDRVGPDELLMIVNISLLAQVLIEQLREEVQGSTI